jgi:hypothetical protein
MSSVVGYFPDGLSVMMESDLSFSKSLAIIITLDRNAALFNPSLDSNHNKTIYNARELTRFCLRLTRRSSGGLTRHLLCSPFLWPTGGYIDLLYGRPDHRRIVIYFLTDAPVFAHKSFWNPPFHVQVKKNGSRQRLTSPRSVVFRTTALTSLY